MKTFGFFSSRPDGTRFANLLYSSIRGIIVKNPPLVPDPGETRGVLMKMPDPLKIPLRGAKNR